MPRQEAPAFGGKPRAYAALGLNTGRYRERASFWGGRPADDATAYDDGGAHSPTDLGWNPILSPGSALSESHRRYVSAWYGRDRVFIWGGQRYVAGQPPIVLGNGASWDLQSRTWIPMESGGPSSRACTSAAWTGSEAIVWSGFDQSGGSERLLADGMIYQPPPRSIRADTLDAGSYFSCTFVEDGALECWGAMSWFSVDPAANPRRPYVIRGLRATGPHPVSLGRGHGCALVDGDGVVRCFGNNSFGAVGGAANGAIVVSLPRPALQVSAGGDLSCALLNSREVWCWVHDLSDAVHLAVGGWYACAARASGQRQTTKLCGRSNPSRKALTPEFVRSPSPSQCGRNRFRSHSGVTVSPVKTPRAYPVGETGLRIGRELRADGLMGGIFGALIGPQDRPKPARQNEPDHFIFSHLRTS